MIKRPLPAPKIALGLALTAGFGLLSCVSNTPPKTPPAPEQVKAAPVSSREAAGPVTDLLALLANYDRNGRSSSQKIGFELPESAVNAYLAYSLSLRPRPGVRAVKVALLPQNQVSVDVELDFDAIQHWGSWMVPDALRAVLSGQKTIRLNAGFQAENGLLTITWNDAKGPQGPILSNVLAGLLQSVGSHQPESYDTTKPLPLPFGLKRVWTEKQLIGGQT